MAFSKRDRARYSERRQLLSSLHASSPALTRIGLTGSEEKR
jgi:hypothetical protein